MLQVFSLIIFLISFDSNASVKWQEKSLKTFRVETDCGPKFICSGQYEEIKSKKEIDKLLFHIKIEEDLLTKKIAKGKEADPKDLIKLNSIKIKTFKLLQGASSPFNVICPTEKLGVCPDPVTCYSDYIKNIVLTGTPTKPNKKTEFLYEKMLNAKLKDLMIGKGDFGEYQNEEIVGKFLNIELEKLIEPYQLDKTKFKSFDELRQKIVFNINKDLSKVPIFKNKDSYGDPESFPLPSGIVVENGELRFNYISPVMREIPNIEDIFPKKYFCKYHKSPSKCLKRLRYCGPVYNPSLLDKSYEELEKSENYIEMAAKSHREGGLARNSCYLTRLVDKLPNRKITWLFEHLFDQDGFTPMPPISDMFGEAPKKMDKSVSHLLDKYLELNIDSDYLTDEETRLNMLRLLNGVKTDCKPNGKNISLLSYIRPITDSNECSEKLLKNLNNQSPEFKRGWKDSITRLKEDYHSSMKFFEDMNANRKLLYSNKNIKKFIFCKKLKEKLGEHWDSIPSGKGVDKLLKERNNCGKAPESEFPSDYERWIYEDMQNLAKARRKFKLYLDSKELYYKALRTKAAVLNEPDKMELNKFFKKDAGVLSKLFNGMFKNPLMEKPDFDSSSIENILSFEKGLFGKSFKLVAEEHNEFYKLLGIKQLVVENRDPNMELDLENMGLKFDMPHISPPRFVEDILGGAQKVLDSVFRPTQEGLDKIFSFTSKHGHKAKRWVDKKSEEAANAAKKFVEETVKNVAKATEKAIQDIGKTTEKGLHDLGNTLHKSLSDLNEETKRGLEATAKALKAAGNPKDLARIALVYTAVAMGGPMGAAAMNMILDKLENPNMTEEQMLKSFAIGAAAGYAAAAAGGGGGIARNLVQDAGDIIINGKPYSSQAFFASVGKGAIPLNGSGTIASSVANSATRSVAELVIDAAAYGKSIDREDLSNAIYNGAARGFTRASVEHITEEYVVNNIPDEYKGRDKELFKALKGAAEKSEELELREEFKREIDKFDENQKVDLAKLLEDKTQVHLEKLAQSTFKKPYSELTDAEKSSDEFQESIAETKDEFEANVRKDSIKLVSGKSGSDREPASAAVIELIVVGAAVLASTAVVQQTTKPDSSSTDFKPGWGRQAIELDGDIWSHIKLASENAQSGTSDIDHSEVNNEDNSEEELAEKISRGHAWEKHQSEFPELQSEEEFAEHIEEVMKNPTEVKELKRGRRAYWDEKSGTVVIIDPKHVDGGTAFKPDDKKTYFNNLR